MSQAITRHMSPEEREYQRYLVEIEIRKGRLAELQADLAAYKEELGRFNAEYHVRVGVLFVELDRIELQIKEYEFRIAQLRANPDIDPDDLEQQTKQQFTEEREQTSARLSAKDGKPVADSWSQRRGHGGWKPTNGSPCDRSSDGSSITDGPAF